MAVVTCYVVNCHKTIICCSNKEKPLCIWSLLTRPLCAWIVLAFFLYGDDGRSGLFSWPSYPFTWSLFPQIFENLVVPNFLSDRWLFTLALSELPIYVSEFTKNKSILHNFFYKKTLMPNSHGT